jgi:conjugal transfer pilus assembly protein TraV
MRFMSLLCLTAGPALLGGCATLGTNIDGDFACRAPQGTCAPSHVIDAEVTKEPANSPESAAHPISRGVTGGDTARTGERTLRIVFPAHVDEAGILHDEAVAWAVVETPRWAAEMRRKPDDAPPLMRQLRRQLKDAQRPKADAGTEATVPDIDLPFAPAAQPLSLLPPTSPLALPSTVREVIAGASTPAVEGFDIAPSLDDRTPRHTDTLKAPSDAAIDAAKAKRPSSTKEPR